MWGIVLAALAATSTATATGIPTVLSHSVFGVATSALADSSAGGVQAPGAEHAVPVCATLFAKRPKRKRRFIPARATAPGESDPLRTFLYNHELALEVWIPQLDSSMADGNARFLQSCEVNRIAVHTVPRFGVPGFGAALTRRVARQRKLKETERADVVVLYIDNPADLIFGAEQTEILRGFQDITHPNKSTVLFPATRRCKLLCATTSFQWPKVATGSKYIDSQIFIGRILDVIDFVRLIPAPNPELGAVGVTVHHHVATLYSTQQHGLVADHRYALFQNLAGYGSDLSDNEFGLQFEFRGRNDTRLENKYFSSHPGIIYGGGNTRLINQIGNYVPLEWMPADGDSTDPACDLEARPTSPSCWEGPNRTISYTDRLLSPALKAPRCLIVVFVEELSPFLPRVLDGISSQNYPKDRVTLQLHVAPSASRAAYTAQINRWRAGLVAGAAMHDRKDAEGTPGYAALTVQDAENAASALNVSLAIARKGQYERFVFTTSHAFINNTETLRHLVEENRTAISPMITREGRYWSNFWGSLIGGIHAQCFDEEAECVAYAAKDFCTEGEYVEWMHLYCAATCGNCTIASSNTTNMGYKRSFDYQELTARASNRRGVWNVPIILDFIVLNRAGISKVQAGFGADLTNNPDSTDRATKGSMFQAFETWELLLQMLVWIHERHGFTFISNHALFGYLVDPTGFRHTWLHPDLFLHEGNPALWREQYLHRDYQPSARNETVEPHCWDIFSFPLVNEAFCDELVADAEAYGDWSGSQEQDKRLRGGYEPVPTQDIHFNQFGFDSTWKQVLKAFVKPVVEATFPGYTVRAAVTLDFIVRYRPSGQSSLRPHSDASTFSVNVALNSHGEDYQGGGTRFIRQNCTYQGTKGHAIVHPGMLTHQHEGLETTDGSRYIVVSFVDQPRAG